MLSKLSLVSVSVVMLGGGGLALAGTAETFVAVDTNADALISVEEFQAAYPDLDSEAFAALDANADSQLSPSEFIGSNLPDLPPSEG
ncbi:MAG: hypothetical protein AAGF44_12155 [Pseudomonadota bacterium]